MKRLGLIIILTGILAVWIPGLCLSGEVSGTKEKAKADKVIKLEKIIVTGEGGRTRC